MERRTQQRDAIQSAFEKAGVPLSPQELLTLANGQKSGLGLATIYRNINNLLELGWLVKVEMPGAVAQLLHQDLLGGSRGARQESGQVGVEFGTGDDDDANQHEREPDADRQSRRRAHGASAVIVVTERSPSASMTSIETIRFLLPPMRIWRTTASIAGSVGARDRRHCSELPSTLMR